MIGNRLLPQLSRITPAALGLCLLLSSSLCPAETLRLVDGTAVSGRIASMRGSEVVLVRGCVEQKLAKSRFARPDAMTFGEAQAAFDRKQYAIACDLCRQILLWQPTHGRAWDLWRQGHGQEVREQVALLVGRATRDAAAARLKEIAVQDDLPVLCEALDRTNPRVQQTMAWVMAYLKWEASVVALGQCLAGAGDAGVRGAAAWALGEIGSAEAVTVLRAALAGDADVGVRTRAGEALNKIGTPTALGAIQESSVADRSHVVRDEMTLVRENPGYRRTSQPDLRAGQVSVGYLAGTRYLVYVPRSYQPRKRTSLLIAVHGTGGTAEAYEAICHQEAERLGLILLAPHFDYGQYPDFGAFNLGLRFNRADLRLLEIVDDLSRSLNFDRNRLLLFGHSQGGWFVQRFVLAHPQRVARAAACGVGGGVVPDAGAVFPVGTGPSDWAPDLKDLDFGKLVQARLAIVLGSKETVGQQTAAQDFVDTAQDYARTHSLQSNVVFIPVPEGGHAGESNFPAASKFLFDGLTGSSPTFRPGRAPPARPAEPEEPDG